MSKPLLEVQGLKTYFSTEEALIKAVDGVDFKIYEGEILGIVGESGCGKSVTSLSIMRLIPQPPGEIVDGKILFKDRDLLKLSKEEMRKIRGNEISMIFQEPMTSLTPVFSIGNQLSEVIRLHQNKNKKEALEKSIQLLDQVGIPLPEQRVHEYPHQLSGGMRQRVMIAMALACNPALLIADEPTTALDVTIQAQILHLIKELIKDFHSSVIFITHDLGVIAEIADRTIVMYAGKVVESAEVNTIFKTPQHPYTWGLMNSIPKLEKVKKRLHPIRGVVPDPEDKPVGCNFHPRCDFADEKCRKSEPLLEDIGNNHMVSCWNYHRVNKKLQNVQRGC